MQVSDQSLTPSFQFSPETLDLVHRTFYDFFVRSLLSGNVTNLEKLLYTYKTKGIVLSKNLEILWGIAQATENHEALKMLDEFDPNLGTIVQVKLLAHRFSITGTSEIEEQSFDLQGFDYRITFQAMYNSLKLHLASNEQKTILPIFETILKVERERDVHRKAQILYEEYTLGKTIFLPLKFSLDRDAHIYGFMVKGNILTKLNNGLHECLPSGLHVYRMEDTSNFTPEFIEKMLTTNIELDYFEKDVDQELSLVFDKYIQTSPLKGGFCSWALAKMALRGGFVLEKIEGEKIKYKKWSRADRIKEANDYLKQKDRDPKIVASLWCRIKDKGLSKAIEKKLSILHIANGQSSPLHLAAESGNIPVCEKLLKKGWNVDIEDSEGCAPLIYAARRGRFEVVKYLLEKGAEVNKEDRNGLNAYCHLMIRKEDCAKNPKMEHRFKQVQIELDKKNVNKRLSNIFRSLAI